MNGLSYLVQV